MLSIVCALAPDLDAIGYALGIKYDSLFGHRGFSHSFLFALLPALALTYIFFRRESNKLKWLLFFNFLIIGVIHILLDAMTNGGLGVALFSPFSNARYFFPWRPIEVSAILPQYFWRLNGLNVLKFELTYLVIPSLVYVFIITFWQRKNNLKI